MTVIRPNSVSGITSITAQANEINVFRSNGLLAGLNLNGVNFNTTAGISTLAALKITGNLDVAGVLTYQDVTNVDSLGIGTFRVGVNVPAGQLDVGSNIKLGNAGVVTATSFVGSGANLTSLPAQATIANNADNRVITGGSGVNLNGEEKLNWNGQVFGVGTASPNVLGNDNMHTILSVIETSGTRRGQIELGGNQNVDGAGIGDIHFVGHYQNANHKDMASITANHEGSTSGQRGAYLSFNTKADASTSILERLRITSGGTVQLPVNGQQLTWGASQQMKFYYENSEDRMYLKGDGAYGFAFRINNGNRIEIDKTTGDITMQGSSGRNFQWDNSDASLYLTDNGSGASARLKVGTGGDLQLYHDVGGANHIVCANNSELKISAYNHTFYNYSGVSKRMEITSSGYVGINRGTPAEYLDVDGGARFRSYVYIGDGFFFKSAAYGGNTNLDTGISINQGGRGGVALLFVSRNYNSGTGTSGGLYRIKWYYDGNNAPSTDHMSGDAFISFGVSGSNTLTINGGGGNQLYGIINVTA